MNSIMQIKTFKGILKMGVLVEVSVHWRLVLAGLGVIGIEQLFVSILFVTLQCLVAQILHGLAAV